MRVRVPLTPLKNYIAGWTGGGYQPGLISRMTWVRLPLPQLKKENDGVGDIDVCRHPNPMISFFVHSLLQRMVVYFLDGRLTVGQGAQKAPVCGFESHPDVENNTT